MRSRAKTSLASLTGCKSLSGKGSPPTRSASCVQGGVVRRLTANKRGEAETAYPGGRRGDRAPCSAGTASQRLMADAEGLNAPEGHPRTAARARRGRSAGVLRPWQAGREAAQHWGAPSSSCTEVATGPGLQLLRPSRGNPDTEQGWTLNPATHHETHREAAAVRRRRLGSLITRSPQRWGKPTTRGRT